MASKDSHDGGAAATLASRGPFGALLWVGRHRVNLSQEELAARAGLVSARYVVSRRAGCGRRGGYRVPCDPEL